MALKGQQVTEFAAGSALELRYLRKKVYHWRASRDWIYDVERNQIRDDFWYSYKSSVRPNDGKGLPGKWTKPLEGSNFVNRTTLKWFWDEPKGL